MLNTKIKESQEIFLDERSVNLREQIIKSVISDTDCDFISNPVFGE